MGWILKLLGGGAGFWFLLGGLLAASAAGGVAGYQARGLVDAPALDAATLATSKAQNETVTCQRDHEHGLAVGNAKVAKDLQNSITNLNQAIDALAKQKAARDANTSKFLDALALLPKTSVCAGSAAERAYRDSLQHQAGGAALP